MGSEDTKDNVILCEPEGVDVGCFCVCYCSEDLGFLGRGGGTEDAVLWSGAKLEVVVVYIAGFGTATGMGGGDRTCEEGMESGLVDYADGFKSGRVETLEEMGVCFEIKVGFGAVFGGAVFSGVWKAGIVFGYGNAGVDGRSEGYVRVRFFEEWGECAEELAKI